MFRSDFRAPRASLVQSGLIQLGWRTLSDDEQTALLERPGMSEWKLGAILMQRGRNRVSETIDAVLVLILVAGIVSAPVWFVALARLN